MPDTYRALMLIFKIVAQSRRHQLHVFDEETEILRSVIACLSSKSSYELKSWTAWLKLVKYKMSFPREVDAREISCVRNLIFSSQIKKKYHIFYFWRCFLTKCRTTISISWEEKKIFFICMKLPRWHLDQRKIQSPTVSVNSPVSDFEGGFLEGINDFRKGLLPL